MNPLVSVFDETYNPDHSETYWLSLYKSADFLYYCIIDSVRKKFIGLRAFSASDKHFEEQIQDDVYLGRQYKKVNLLFHSPEAMLIPLPLTDEKTVTKLFAFTFGKSEFDSLPVVSMVNDSVAAAFVIPEPDVPFARRFAGSRVVHPYEFMIRDALRRSKKNKIVMAELYHQGMIISAASDASLLYCNYLPCNGEGDFAYHLTAVYKLLGFSTEETPLYISGTADRKDPRLMETSRFIKKILPRIPNTTYLFSYRINDEHRQTMSLLFEIHHEDHQR